MCGISGIISEKEVYQSDILAMTMALAHRGPDAQDFFLKENARVALGHTRLSIIDISEVANQPMFSPDGRFVIVFNGEIYNYRSLQKELLNINSEIIFKTHSDTEVILHGFMQWGSSLCTKLEGMFALAIYDQELEELFLCRDRVGKKPLYYHLGVENFLFASEIKSLLKHPVMKDSRSVNFDAINSFLHLGYIPEPDTAYRSIRKFPSGHYAYIKKGLMLSITSFCNLNDYVKEPCVWKKSEAIQTLKLSLIKAVEKRLISDVPLGAFLSGGTDSSLIVAMASQIKNEPLKTFNIGFHENVFDESKYARKVSKKLKTDHYEYLLDEKEAVNILERHLDHFDEPFADTSAIPMMLVSQLARKEVTVALTGDGGDELFLGYGSYDWANLLDQLWMQAFQSPLSFILKKFGNDRWKRIAFLLQRVNDDEIRSHIFSQEQYFFTRKEITMMSSKSKPGFESLKYQDPDAKHLNAAEKQALYDIRLYLKDDLLVKVDRASMLYGLECRCPFLDPQVMALALSLPFGLKKNGGERKWILKEILKDYLPADLIYRPKRGFSIPLAHWMKNDLAYLIDRYLNRDIVADIGIVKYHYVHRLKISFSNGDNFLYNRLWVLIVAHKWLYENSR